MLATLRFVQGAVSRKDFVPAMSHFAIENGVIRSFNGVVALSSPIGIDFDCKPKAEPMIRAISKCEGPVALSMTPAGKLRITSGRFRAFVDCIEESAIHVEPEGQRHEVDGNVVIAALKAIYPIIGDDASRPWSTGALFRGDTVLATNNVILVQYWTAYQFPIEVNVPRAAIKEVVRIGEPPCAIQYTDTSITFHYPDGKWVRSQVLETGWPDLSSLLQIEGDLQTLDPDMFTGLVALRDFCDALGRIYMTPKGLRTNLEDGVGGVFDIDGLPEAVFNYEMLGKLNGLATEADFTKHPAPCPFRGDRLRGVIVGLRV